MGTRKTAESEAASGLSVASANTVHLVGRLSEVAAERVLPSDAVMCTFALVVDRLDTQLASRQRVDVLPCVAWSGRVRRSAQAWRPGDVIEISGALRKRFFRTKAGTTGSRMEVEVASARRLRRMAA
jgi:single-strand DNA-binding protein